MNQGLRDQDQKAAEARGLLPLFSGQDVEPAEDSDGAGRRSRIAPTIATGLLVFTWTSKPATRIGPGRNGAMAIRDTAIQPEAGLLAAAKPTMDTGYDFTDAAAQFGKYHSIRDCPPQTWERASQPPGSFAPRKGRPFSTGRPALERLTLQRTPHRMISERRLPAVKQKVVPLPQTAVLINPPVVTVVHAPRRVGDTGS